MRKWKPCPNRTFRLCDEAAKAAFEEAIHCQDVEVRVGSSGDPYIVVFVDFDPPAAPMPFACINGFSVYREKRLA